MIRWGPDPILVDFGSIQIRWYGLCFLAGFLIGYQIMRWMCKVEKKPFEVLDPLLTYVIAGTIIGARLGHCLFYDPAYYLSNPIAILKIWEGGLASHGGTLGVFAALWLFSRRQKMFSLPWLFDHLVVPVALVAGLIRFGNLMNSEILGKPTSLPWAFIFERVDQVPRHPAQLYESLTYFALFGLTMFLYKKNPYRPAGFIFGLSMIVIFGTRIIWEYFKEDQEAFEAGMFMNMGQLLSIPFVLLGIYLVVRAVRSQAQIKSSR